MDIISHFQQLGLSQKEAEAYLQLLQLGTQPASAIARKMQIPRSSAHFILSELSKHQFVRQSNRGNTILFTAELPQNIPQILESEKERLINKKDQQLDLARKLMPQLEGMMSKYTSIPKITFYEGDEGLTKVYEDTLTSSETIRSIASFDSMHEVLPDYFKNYYKRRAEKNILIRSIHPDSPAARERMKLNQSECREAYLIPKDRYDFLPEIQLYDGKTVITSWNEKLGILIESKDTTQALGVLFELAWEEAKRLNDRSHPGTAKTRANSRPRSTPPRQSGKEKKKNG